MTWDEHWEQIEQQVGDVRPGEAVFVDGVTVVFWK